MTNTVTLQMTYEAVDTAVVDLSPKTWADVSDWYVKWSKLYVQFEDETVWHEYDMSEESSPEIDYKRPSRTDVYVGEFEFDETLDTQEGF